MREEASGKRRFKIDNYKKQNKSLTVTISWNKKIRPSLVYKNHFEKVRATKLPRDNQ